MRIRHRLLIAFALILLPLLLLEVYEVGREYRERRAEILRGHRDTAEAVAASVEALVRDMVDRARTTAPSAGGSRGAAAEIQRRFQDLREWGPDIVVVTRADPQGRIVETDPPGMMREGVTIADQPYFQAVAGGRDWAVSDLLQGRLRGGPTWVVAAAARGTGQALQGVVALSMRPEIFERVLGRVGVSGRGSTVAIVDRSGRAVFVSGRPDLPWEQRDWSRIPSVQRALHGDPVVAEEIPSGADERVRLGARVPIRGIGWVASVTTPVDEALAPVRRAAWRHLGLLAGITLLSAGAAVVLGRSLASPIATLRREVQGLAGGDLSRRVAVRGRDEVAGLGQAFNEMGERLEAAWRDARATTRELAEKASRLEALTHLSRLLMSPMSYEEVLQSVVTAANRLLEASMALLLVVDREADDLVVRARAGGRWSDMRRVERFRRGEGLVGWVWEHKAPLAVAEVLEDPRWLNPEWARGEALHGFAGLPLLTGADCIGVLCVMRADARAFTAADQELLQAFAAQAALAIENTRLYTEAGREAGRLRALNAVADLISSSLDPGQVFQFIVRSAANLLGDAVAWLMVLDQTAGDLRVEAAFGWRHPDLRARSTFRLGEGVPGIIAATREPIAVPDVQGDPRFVNVEWARAEGLRGFAGVPLVVRDRSVGVLCVMRRSTTPWAAEDLDLLTALCAHAALAVENARLYAEAASRAEEMDRRSHALEALNETARLISSESDFLVLLQKVADSARRLARSRYAALGVLGPDGGLARFIQSGLEEEAVRRIGDLPTGKGLLGVILREGRPLRAADLRADPRAAGFPPHHPPMRSFMGVPIVAEGRVVGSLYLTDKLAGEAFSDEDERLLMAFASHAAIALEQARLAQQTRDDAATKATLLRELHHRVRNNLASIIGLLSMELTRPGRRSAEEAIQACIERVHSIAEVHELLATGEFGPVDLNHMFRSIARSHFQHAAPGGASVEVQVEGPRLTVPPRHLTALALIANEVLINAAKHAFRGRGRGTVAIRTSLASDGVTVEIRDDGVGLGAGRGGDGSGLGLEIVEALARADLGGDFRLYEEGGTVAVVRFPKPQQAAAEREGMA